MSNIIFFGGEGGGALWSTEGARELDPHSQAGSNGGMDVMNVNILKAASHPKWEMKENANE